MGDSANRIGFPAGPWERTREDDSHGHHSQPGAMALALAVRIERRWRRCRWGVGVASFAASLALLHWVG